MKTQLNKAYEIANNEDVTTALNGAVVYSVSYMPNDNNKLEAFAFIKKHPEAKMLDNTPCGKKLIALGLDGKVNEVSKEVTQIWQIASKRYIAAASGNIHAFVTNADKRSTFCTTELAEILKNLNITQINGQDKFVFAKNFKTKYYE